MGQTDQSFGENSGEISPHRIPIPIYDPIAQVHIYDPNDAGSLGSPELNAIAKSHRRVTKELASKAKISIDFVKGQGLEWAIDHTDHDVATNFQAHGINKGIPLLLLKDLLTEGIKNPPGLYTMPFTRETGAAGAFGAETPFTNGGIIVASGYGEDLNTHGVKYVFLGEGYINGIDLLRKTFPNFQIVPWHDIPKTLAEEASKQTGENLPYEVVSQENRPYYAIRTKGGKPISAQQAKDIQIRSTSEPSENDSSDIW